jgi:hypothetical protein
MVAQTKCEPRNHHLHRRRRHAVRTTQRVVQLQRGRFTQLQIQHARGGGEKRNHQCAGCGARHRARLRPSRKRRRGGGIHEHAALDIAA